jgi:tetratricopeptide (TPR) repeat protein
VVLFVFGTSTAAQSAGKWVRIRSDNFVLIGDADPAAIRDAANRLELFRSAIGSLSPEIKLDSGKPTNVVVFRDTASFRAFKPLREDGGPDDAVAGFFQAGDGVNYIAVSAAADAKAYGTIFHEYVHYLLDANFRSGGLPPWLNEGLAEYFETLESVDTPNGRVLSVGKAPVGHVELLRKNLLIPAGEFFAMDNKSLHRNGQESRTLFYGQAWAVVHYLINRDVKNSGMPGSILELLKDKDAREKVLAEAFGSDRAAFENAIRSYIAKTAPARTFPAPPVSNGRQILSANSLTEAQTETYLGDLLFQMGRFAEAEIHLKRALTLDPALAEASTALGKMLVRQNRFSEARPHLARAAASGKADAYTYFSFAYALSREGAAPDGTVSEFKADATKQMLDALRESIRLDPGFHESYRLLAIIHLVDGDDPAEAESAIRRALEIRPNDQDDTLILAKALLRREMYDEAKSLAVKLSVTAADPKIQSDAHEIVRAADEYFRSIGDPSVPNQLVIGALPPLILKRSTLTDEDIAAIDRERVITNLNVVLGRQAEGEVRAIGRVEQVSCADDGVLYKVKTPDASFVLKGGDFADLRLSVLIEGERSFEIGCEAKLAGQPVVLTYRPAENPRAKEKGRLTAIAFVPDFFRLKSQEEMARARTIIVEDDRLFRSNAQKQRGRF